MRDTPPALRKTCRCVHTRSLLNRNAPRGRRCTRGCKVPGARTKKRQRERRRPSSDDLLSTLDPTCRRSAASVRPLTAGPSLCSKRAHSRMCPTWQPQRASSHATDRLIKRHENQVCSVVLETNVLVPLHSTESASLVTWEGRGNHRRSSGGALEASNQGLGERHSRDDSRAQQPQSRPAVQRPSAASRWPRRKLPWSKRGTPASETNPSEGKTMVSAIFP